VRYGNNEESSLDIRRLIPSSDQAQPSSTIAADVELSRMDEGASTSADEQRTAALELEKLIGRWPRRLLHVASMTSYQWQPGNCYGSACCPKYNAISYTWGRFREEDESHQVRTLKIKGITWPVPRIKTNHFDVETLERVIKDCGKGHEKDSEHIGYLWIDIACIDQSGSINSNLEIGRQAQIFRHAQHVYIWLGRTSMPRLQELHSFWCFWKTLKEDFQSGKYDQEALENAQAVLKRLNQEPWFSSVWTLQEAYLRKDAVLLSACGDPNLVPEAYSTDTKSLHQEQYERLRLQHLLDACDAVWLFCWSENPDLQPGDIISQLKNLGIIGLNRNDPMRLYATAMSREPSRETDCIYGIQQIFELRLGTTNPDNKSASYTLEQLENQLGDALMSENPVLSQNFVHTNSNLPIGKRWRLSRNLENPTMSLHYDTPWSHSIYQPRCKLSTKQNGDVLCGWFEGRVCDFALLQQAWKARSLSPAELKLRKQPIVMIQLDVGSELTMRVPTWRLPLTEPGVAGDEALALGIGGLLVEFTNPAVNFDCDDHRSLKVLHLGEYPSAENGCHVGILLYRSIREPRNIWRRVGICAWLARSSSRYGPAADLPGHFVVASQQHVLGKMPLTSTFDENTSKMDVVKYGTVDDAISCNGDQWSLQSGYFG
jgi:hypothetical protein